MVMLHTWEEICAFQDNEDEQFPWREYQVHYPPVDRGDWKIETFSIPRDGNGRKRLIKEGGTLRDPGYGEGFTKIMQKIDGVWEVWMSDTRAEIVEHLPLINKLWWCQHTDTTVLINGLGLGLAVHAALRWKNVTRVDVVELDQNVIELVGPMIQDPRVTIYPHDAYTMPWPSGTEWTLAWHDIWPTIDAENLQGMEQLHRKYGRRVKWQDSWAKNQCLKARKSSKEFVDALRKGDFARVRELDPLF